MGYLDNDGLTRLWAKIKNYIDAHSSGGVTLDKVYPVGSIYMSVNNTNPGTLFGGTWVTWGAGRVPVSVNTSDGDFQRLKRLAVRKHTHYQLMKCRHTNILQQLKLQKNHLQVQCIILQGRVQVGVRGTR